MGPVLILGGSGFIGHHLAARLQPGQAVVTSRHPPAGSDWVRFESELQDLRGVVPELARFSHALVLVGQTKPDLCAREPEATRRLNVDQVWSLIQVLREHGVVPVFTSTEAVFDGDRGDYGEQDMPAPLMTYARHKLEIETRLRALPDQNWLAVRLARVYGDIPGDGTLFTDLFAQLAQERVLRLAADQLFSPIHVGDVAAGLLGLCQVAAQGLFHLGGPQPFSRHSAALAVAEAMRRHGVSPQATLIAASIADFPTLEPRPRDISLSSERFIATVGLRPAAAGLWIERIAARIFG